MVELDPRAVTEPTGDRGDYLRKRHMSEGPRRRKLSAVDALDADADSRNARIWRDVSHTCLGIVGCSPLESYDTNARDAQSRRAYGALCAAAQICNADYGIPTARLAELAGISPQAMGRRVRKDTADVTAITAAWRQNRGGLRTDTAVIEVTKEAALALAGAAQVTGDSPIVLASAAILAAV